MRIDLKSEYHKLPLDHLKREAATFEKDITIYKARILEYPRLAMTYRAKKSVAEEYLEIINTVIKEKETDIKNAKAN